MGGLIGEQLSDLAIAVRFTHQAIQADFDREIIWPTVVVGCLVNAIRKRKWSFSTKVEVKPVK